MPNVKFARTMLAIPEMGILIPLLGFSLLFFLLTPSFLSPESMASLLRAVAFIGIIAVGQTWLMVAGEIDLSVGAVAGLSLIVSAWLMKNGGLPVELGLLAGVACGALVGLVNGLVTVRIGVPAFIATLSMLYIARGINYLICQGYPIYPIPERLRAFGSAEPLGLSWAFLILLFVVIVGEFCLRKTVWGRCVYATGGNKEVARLAGINVERVKILCFVKVGALAGLAGILQMAQLNVGQPQIGIGWELDVIASVVIGGVSLFGGVGTIIGTFLGLLTLQVVRSGLVMTNCNTHWQTVAVGYIMIVAVGFDIVRRRNKKS